MNPLKCERVRAHPSTVPSFLPFPANPPLNSTPAHSPCFPSISPLYRRVPSKPRLSMRTLSPRSKDLWLWWNASDCRLSGRRVLLLLAKAEVGVLGRELEATEGGLCVELPCAETARAEWRAGSFAFIASAKARSRASVSNCTGEDWADERDRGRPGVNLPGVGMPDVRGFAGVVVIRDEKNGRKSRRCF